MIAVSTAYKKALVAVEIDGKKSTRELDATCKHSENLLPAINDALEEIDKSLARNDFYATVIGPGSFTGIRISTAMVKGFLAGDEGKRVVPITTFELMAYSYIKNFSPKEDFACIINGLSGYYFICHFDAKGQQKSQPEMIEKSLLDMCKETKVSLKEESLSEMVVDPTAEELLCIAKQKLSEGNLIKASDVLPLYLRKSQAESALEEKEKK